MIFFSDLSKGFAVDLGSLRSDKRRHVMSVMFSDTTRLIASFVIWNLFEGLFFKNSFRLRKQLGQQRPSLATLFCHEAPSLGEGKRTRFVTSRPRPSEPPPPPPPVAEVLKPVIPPKNLSFKFSRIEEERINNVINRKNSDLDCICSTEDEFSSDEFDSISDDNNNLGNRAAPGGAEKPKFKITDEEVDNVYDVAEFVEAEKSAANHDHPEDEDDSSGISSYSCSSSQGSSDTNNSAM